MAFLFSCTGVIHSDVSGIRIFLDTREVDHA